jgi:hypothetical protein
MKQSFKREKTLMKSSSLLKEGLIMCLGEIKQSLKHYQLVDILVMMEFVLKIKENIL